MSRSYRKAPIISVTAHGFNHSEKKDKRHARKRWRMALNQWDGENLPPLLREVSNVLSMAKDGKQFLPQWYDKEPRYKWVGK